MSKRKMKPMSVKRARWRNRTTHPVSLFYLYFERALRWRRSYRDDLMDFGILDGYGFKTLLGIPRYDTHDIDIGGLGGVRTGSYSMVERAQTYCYSIVRFLIQEISLFEEIDEKL